MRAVGMLTTLVLAAAVAGAVAVGVRSMPGREALPRDAPDVTGAASDGRIGMDRHRTGGAPAGGAAVRARSARARGTPARTGPAAGPVDRPGRPARTRTATRRSTRRAPSTPDAPQLPTGDQAG